MEPRGPRHANNITSSSCKRPALDAYHTPLQHGTESKFIANWTRTEPVWTRRLNGLAKTHVDRRGPANIAPWTPKISYLTRSSKHDPSKTAFTWDRLCFPEVSGAQLHQNLCGDFVWELQKRGETCLAWTFLHSCRTPLSV